ncbi:serine/threonine-protein kinase [Streptomyces sp. VNUA24]|uniref:serine/threonine-protein kinase n=1 Tax=Streptomyces sp. VNUA24 TaxID=3031131 RepID=UPI0023B7A7F2|nr:serine/threonine-protein kinase [Streptomyces sp. VNUA24]WEH19862.1 serine/threonine-protein kinase [Streptomyces sp. VNUA24]
MGPERTDLPGYEIQEVLGRGGFATVYRARQLAVGREVALKVDSRVLSTPRDRQRFLREVTAAGQLSGHPHVVPVYDAGVLADDRPYMVLELCPGGSLGDRLHRQGAFPLKEARDIGVGLADAVAAAHAAGVLHRDIKPGNVMVNRYGGVALADFGLAAMPRPGRELSVTREALTPAYAPPEAFHMAEPSPAGDVYSLAATVHALLCGRPPHHPEDGTQLSLAELIVRHTWPYADLPGVPPALNAALRHALVADPAGRLSDAGAFRDALAAVDLDTLDLRGGGGGGFGPAPAMTTVPSHPGTPPTTIPPTTAPPYRGAPATTVPPYGVVPPGRGGTTVVPGPEGDGDGGGRKAARRRPAVLAGFAAVAVAVSVSVSVTVVTYGNDDGADGAKDSSASPSTGATAGGAGASGFEVATTAENCPATEVAGVGGRCVATAECWSGIVDISGIVTVSRADCQAKHVWETFAIAPLPKDGMTNNARDLIRHPDVKALCSQKVRAATMTAGGRGVAKEWNVDIVPPSETQWDKGLRVFRCVAAAVTDDGEKTGSQFTVTS